MSDLATEAITPTDIRTTAEVGLPHENNNDIKNTFTVTPKDILESSYAKVVQGTMAEIEDGKVPTFDHAAAFFNFVMRPRIQDRVDTPNLLETYDEEVSDEDKERYEKYKEIHLPFVDTSGQDITLTKDISDQIVTWDDVIVPQGKGEVFPLGFRLSHDDDFDTDLLNLYGEVYKRLSDEDKTKLLSEMGPAIMSDLWDMNELKFLMKKILPSDFTDLTPKEKLEVVKPLFDELWSYDFDSVEMKRLDDYDHPVYGTQIGNKIYEILLSSTLISLSPDINNDMTPWILYLTDKEDFNKSTQLLGKSIVPEQFPILLNSIRTLLRDENISLLQKENLIKIGKILTGHEPDDEVDFYTSLDELYHSISFENYKPNQSATEDEADLIESILQKTEGKKRVLDLGCGTGRHLVELERRQVGKSDDEKVEYIGLETNPRHVQVARQNMGNEGQILEGDWYNIPIEDNSLDAIYCVGRNLPHVEKEDNFKKVIEEVYRVLKPGGVILFDMPNPEKGAYVHAQKRVQKALKRIGVYPELLEQWSESYISYIVDGPGEGKVYNRYAPTTKDVQRLMEQTLRSNIYSQDYGLNHMYCNEVMRTSIDDGEDSENIYYLAQKRDVQISDPELKKLLSEHHNTVEKFNKNIKDINSLKAEQRDLLNLDRSVQIHEYLERMESARSNPVYMDLSQRIEMLEQEHQSLQIRIFNSNDLKERVNNYFKEQLAKLSVSAKEKMAA